MNRSSRALQKYGTDENHCDHQIRLVPTYFPLHRQDANIHARYIHGACCSGDWIPAEERCSSDAVALRFGKVVKSLVKEDGNQHNIQNLEVGDDG